MSASDPSSPSLVDDGRSSSTYTLREEKTRQLVDLPLIADRDKELMSKFLTIPLLSKRT